MSGGGGSEQTTTQTMRYAPYVEEMHSQFLLNLAGHRNSVIATSPYANYAADIVDDDFFGLGYTISSFPSLYDVFGKYMSGMDIEDLWTSAVSNVLTPAAVADAIKDSAVQLSQHITTNVIPKYQRKMRDINAIASSTFVIGKSLIEDKHIKDIGKLCTRAVDNLLPAAKRQWTSSLDWDKKLVTTYASMMKKYYTYRPWVDEYQNKIKVDNLLWPFTVLDFEQKGVYAIQPHSRQSKLLYAGMLNSPAMKAITILSWTAQGAYIGSAWGPYGTIIGGVIGFIVGLADAFLF